MARHGPDWDTSPVRLTPVLVLVAPLVAACGSSGGSGGGGACGVDAQKQWVLEATRDWYFFDDLLPASVDLAAFATAPDLLDHLTATART